MSSDPSKRLSAAIRRDVAQSGVQNLLGVVDTGSVMNFRLEELRNEIADKKLSHLVPAHAKGGGQSMKEEIRVLEGVLAEAEREQLEREARERAAAPLLLMHTSFAFVTRMWEFAIVLLLAELTGNSLFVVSFAQFLSSFAIFSVSPHSGRWLDKTNRLAAMKTILVWKVLSISAAYGLSMLLLHCQELTGEAVAGGLCSVPHSVFVVPIAAATAHLAFATTKMSLEKDWVVTIASGDKDWLSGINSKMTQIDLTCQSVAPVLTGVLYYVMSYFTVALMLLLINVLASICLFALLKKLYEQCPALALTEQSPSSDSQCTNDGNRANNTTKPAVQATKTIMTSGCAGALISFSCLYLTVLSFGSVMIVYLRWAGLPDYYIGLARGVSALAGFTGASVYPCARTRFGLFRTGIFAIWFQAVFVFIAAVGIYFFSAMTGSIIMVVAVLCSRAGLWLFDLCTRQISQETIEQESRGAVNGQWSSLTSFFNFSSFALTCLFSDPEHFWILTTVSSGMVFVAAVIFSASYAIPAPAAHDLKRSAYEAIPDFESMEPDSTRTETTRTRA